MERIIRHLKLAKKHELAQIGLTPRTNFKGNQAEHDKLHKTRAEEYSIAIKILSSKKFIVRDWLVSEHKEYKSFDKANSEYKRILKEAAIAECDVSFYALIDERNNIDKQ